MIVRCENCGTEFGFDDRQIGEGITVRCSVCKHVFKVESPTAAAQGWQIRTTEGTSFKAPDVATLREWIDEGRLHPDDQVSRTGRNWVRLGDMPEFARAFAGFQGVAAVASPVREADPARAAGVGMPRPPSVPPSSVSTLPPMPPQSQRPTVSPPRSHPAAAAAPVGPSRPPSGPRSAPPARPVIPPPTRVPELEDYDDDLSAADDDDPTAVAIPSRPREPSEPKVRPAPVPTPAAPKPTERRVSEDLEPDEPDDDASLDAFEPEIKERRGISPGLIAFLGVIAAVGVMFGVPSIRTKLLGLGQDQPGEEQPSTQVGRVAEIEAAELALQKLGIAALARAEADLQRAIDAGGGDSTTTAAMKVALADLLLNRAIAYEIAATLDAEQRDDFRRRASEDQEDGERLIDGVQGAPDADRLAEVRALARVAAGRAEAEVLPLVPAGATETKLIVQAAILWRDPQAPVPTGLVGGLSELRSRSGLGESALALALVRAGDTVAARDVAERLLVGAEDQVVALAIRAHVGEEAPSGETEGAAETEGEVAADTAGDPNVAKAPPTPDKTEGEDSGGNSGSSGGGGGGSFDKLVERGCSQVSSGDAAAGVKTLLRAFDMKDKDLDVLVCLADGYAAQGQNTQAGTFYDRALEQSPNNIPALRGAAKLAAKIGSDERALKLYERLLAADPDNATAQAYLAKHKPQDDPPAEPSPESSGG
jgi:predicted Zn finger-like uncharacterized protein